jgi:very-short-patch-repair endonuclease
MINKQKINSGWFKKGHKPVFTVERNKKLSQKLKGHIVTEITREKLRKANLGKKYPPRSIEHRKKMSIKMMGNKSPLGCKRSDAFKKERSVRMTLCNPMKNPLISRKQMDTQIARNWKPTFKYSDTSIELKIEAELKLRNINYQKQVWICRCLVDFYLPETRTIIECDGDYWHNLPGAQEKDARKNNLWGFNGFAVYRFWEHEINKSPKDCINKIIF